MKLDTANQTLEPNRRKSGAWIVSAIAAAIMPVSAQDQSGGTQPKMDTSVDLAPVVVTGTRTERSILEVPVRTELISADEIELSNSVKLADIVEYQAGLRVESNCQNCNTSEIRMLGLQQRYIAVLTDGMPMFSGLAGVYGIEQIPTATIDQIEVVKGGGSTLYGPNAIAGVINIIPRTPTHNHFSLNAQVSRMEGDQSGDRPNTDVTGVFEWASKDRRYGLLAYGFQNFVQGVDFTGDEMTEVTRRDLHGGGARFNYQPNDTLQLALDYLYTYEDRRGGEDEEGLDVKANEAFLTEELLSARHVGIATLKDTVSDSFDYQAGVSVSYTGRDSYYGGIGPLGYAPPGTPLHDPAVVARLSTRFPVFAPAFAAPGGVFYNAGWTPTLGFGRTDNTLTTTDIGANSYLGDAHTLTYGFQTRLESLEDTSGVGRTIDDNYENYGLYLQHSWLVGDNWEFLWGVRGDKHSKVDNPIISPRGAVKLRASDNVDWRFSASTGFRAPEIFDEDLHVGNVGGELEVVTLSPTLKEERSYSFSLGPNWRINKQWTFDGNLFYTGIDDVFFNDQSTDNPLTPGILESTKMNSGSARVFGAELNLSYTYKKFTGEIGYVEQRSEFGRTQVLTGTVGGPPTDNPIFTDRFDRTPNRYGVVKMGYDDSVWSGFVAGRYTGNMVAAHIVNDPVTGAQLRNERVTTPNFFLVDIVLSRTWALTDHAKLTASLGVKNVFNGFQRDLDDGPFRDSDFVYGPRFPRTYFTGINLEF